MPSVIFFFLPFFIEMARILTRHEKTISTYFEEAYVQNRKSANGKIKNKNKNPSILGAQDITGGEALAGGLPFSFTERVSRASTCRKRSSCCKPYTITVTRGRCTPYFSSRYAPVYLRGKNLKGFNVQENTIPISNLQTAGSDLPHYKFSGDVGCDNY